MEEIKDLIKQEDYEKCKKLLQEFECKAIDIIEDLTYQFKETLAEDIDRKIKGWKDEYERLLKENWKKDDRIAELEKELAKYKELQDQLGLENADEFEWFVMLDLLTDNEKNMHILDLHRELAEIKENAIMPRFKVGQEVYSVFINRKYMEYNEVCNLEITAIMQCSKGIYYQGYILESGKNRSDYWFNEKNTFLTEQEAQDKLQELRGGE